MRRSATLWHVCHLAFVMQVVTVVARLLWHLVLCKGQAFVHTDISEDAQTKVCPFSSGASALTHVLSITAQLSTLIRQHWIPALLKCVT